MFWLLFKAFKIFSSEKKTTTEASKTRSAAGFIVLNIIRMCSIISLAMVIAGSWIMLVRTVQTSNFYFFDAFSHLITSFVSVFLIISELSLFKPYFASNWPLLGPSSSFFILGSSMFVLGMNILGNLNKTATSVENLGLPLWRVTIAGGILSSVFGGLNIIATFVFPNRKQGITARAIRSYSATPPSSEHPYDTKTLHSLDEEECGDSSIHSYDLPSKDTRRSLRFDFKNFRSSFISKSMPIDPERASPIFPSVRRPDTALHPANRGDFSPRLEEVKASYQPGRRAYTASQYSVAESRF